MSLPEIDRRGLLAAGGAALLGGALPRVAMAQAVSTVPVTVDLREQRGPLPQIWSHCAGSDRAAITLRESWRRDLDRWRNEVGLQQVRFHGILNDELGVDAPSILNRNHPAPNYQNIDRVYDGLVEHGVRPLIELSFMPKALASGDATFGFYRGNITPPASLDAWGGFIRDLVRHLADRYGVAELRRWPFEVWNEPNLPFFWTGNQQQYFDLYRTTALAIKSVDPALPVGGPVTAQGQWVPELARFCETSNTPIDFFSTHTYGSDNQRSVFGENRQLAQADVIPASIRQRRQEIDATRFAGKPLWFTEWSSDSPATIAHVIANSVDHCQLMSQWVMSGTYEELGVFDFVLPDGTGNYSTMVDAIALPAFNTYKLLHALGAQRLAGDGPVLAARGARGAAALVWNLADVSAPSGLPLPGATAARRVTGSRKRFVVTFRGARPGQAVRIRYVDQERGSPFPAWRAMGSPRYPTIAQKAELRRRADIAPPVPARLDARGSIALDLPPEGVALIELVG